MKNMKIYKLILLLVFAQFLYSCGVVKQGFTNERKNSSDEFFVQKKSPLVMPPNYNELPLPKTENEQTESEESKIKELLTKEKNENNIKNTEDLNKSFEDMLLEKIKKN